MRTISQGSDVLVFNTANSYTPRYNVVVGDLVEPGRDCIETCLNGGSWLVNTRRWTSPDGSRTVATKTWTPKYVINSDGEWEFAGCGCPELNSMYTPTVSVDVEGAVGQRYDIVAGRTLFDPRGGELIDTSDTPGRRSGVIGGAGEYGTDFTFRLMHDETDGTMPPPSFWVSAYLGDALPAIDVAIMPRQQIFSNCFAACSREVQIANANDVWIPVLNGCQTDLRDSVVAAAARLSNNFSIAAYLEEEVGIALTNLESPSLQDVVVVRLNLPGMTVNTSLLPFTVNSGGAFVFDQNFSLYEVKHFHSDGSILEAPSIELISPSKMVHTPNVSLEDYFGNESRLIMMKNKSPGVCTDCGREEFGGSCDLTGEWFLSKIGDNSRSEMKLIAQLG